MTRLRCVRLVICGTAVVTLLTWIALCGMAESLFRKTPYLVYRNDPTEMTLVWQSFESTPTSLEVRPDIGGAPLIFLAEESADHLYRADAQGLAPGTAYSYTVRLGSEAFSGRFVTAPLPGNGRTVFFGMSDTQEASTLEIRIPWGPEANTRVYDYVTSGMPALINSFSSEISGIREPTFCLHGGDWLNADAYCPEFVGSQWREVDTDKEGLSVLLSRLAPIASTMPLQGCFGNHDCAPVGDVFTNPLTRYFPYPYANPPADGYFFDFGAVRVIVADSNELGRGDVEHVSWLIDEVGRAQARPWTVLLLHDYLYVAWPCPATFGLYGLEWKWPERSLFEALCKRGLDLIVAGNVHCHRFMQWDGSTPSRQAAPDEGKIPVLVMATTSLLPLPTPTACYPTYYRFTIDGSHMTIEAKRGNEKVYQTNSLTSRP